MRQIPATDQCPPVPPQYASVYARTIHAACVVVGGVDRIAAALQVPGHAIRRWISGEEEPPEKPFLAAVEIILLAVAHGPAH